MDIEFRHVKSTGSRVDGRIANTTPRELRCLILRRTNDAILANIVEFIAESIDAISRKLTNGDPRTTAQALNDIIDLITMTNRMFGTPLSFRARTLTRRQINRLFAEEYNVVAPDIAEYIRDNIMKIRNGLNNVETEVDIVAFMGELADLMAALQCALSGYDDGRMIYRGRRAELICR